MNSIESMNCLRKRFKLTKVILLNFDHSDDSTRHNIFVLYVKIFAFGETNLTLRQ